MKEPWNFEAPLCAEIDINLFFPDLEDNRIDARHAKSMCQRCDHLTDCLEWAIKNNEVGIWGGTNQKTREAIKRRRKLSA